jgi:hypothetical protein
MRGGREDERTRGREDDKIRIGWEQRYRVCRGAVGLRPALPQGGGSWF